MRIASPDSRTCRRPAVVFVGTSFPSRAPASTTTVRRPRSSARSRRANSSPCRIPVRQAKRTRFPYGSTVSQASRSTSLQSRKRISVRSLRGARTRRTPSSIVRPRSLALRRIILSVSSISSAARGAFCARAKTWSSTSAARIVSSCHSLKRASRPQRVAATGERRGPHALRVPLEPPFDELRKRLRLGRGERAEGDSPVDLVAQDLGITLSRPDRLPAVASVGEGLLHGPAVAAPDDARLLPHLLDLPLRSRTAAAAVRRQRPCCPCASAGRSSPLEREACRTNSLSGTCHAFVTDGHRSQV
jgi:hypothetical protein